MTEFALWQALTEQPQPLPALAGASGLRLEQAQKILAGWLAQGLVLRAEGGYRLPGWAIANLEGWHGPYYYLPEVGSTQDELRSLAEAGAAVGTLVVAEIQRSGRGRRGQLWESAPGAGLTFSILLRPELPGPYQLALALAVQEAAGVERVKWPNDILAPDGAKLAGILLEAVWRGTSLRYLLAGVGLNFAPPGQAGRSGLWQWSRLSRRDFLLRFQERWQAWQSPLALAEAPETFAQRWGGLGKIVTVHTPAGELTGRAVGIDSEGALLLEAGETRRVPAGWLASG